MRTRSSGVGLLLCALLGTGCDLIWPYAVQPAGRRDGTADRDAKQPADANAADLPLPDSPAVFDAAAVDAAAAADGGWAACLEMPGQYVCVGNKVGTYGCGAGCGEYAVDCTDQGKCSCARGEQTQPCVGTPPGTSCDQCMSVVLDPLCCAGL